MAIFAGDRIYNNNVFGTVADSPLLVGATTLNAAGLANLDAISGDHAVLVLDPLRSAGAPEIVIVTAHTASATSATISRGAYGTSARQHAAGVLWVHAATEADLIQVLTANPSDNHEGQLWYRSDTDIFMAHDGSAAVEALPIGAWQDYTPTDANLTVGNGTLAGRWTRMGRLIVATFQFTFGSTSAITSGLSIGVPVQAANEGTAYVGSVRLLDSGTRNYMGQWLLLADGTQGFIIHTESGGQGQVDATNPFTWTTNDVIGGTITYEAAS